MTIYEYAIARVVRQLGEIDWPTKEDEDLLKILIPVFVKIDARDAGRAPVLVPRQGQADVEQHD